VRIANHVQRRRPLHQRHVRAVFNQQAPDALLPIRRLHEQGVKLGVAIISRNDSGKAHDGAFPLGDKHVASHDLAERYLDRVGIPEQSLPIAGIVEGGTPLQGLESELFGDNGVTANHRK
jgi:hypothetical protein